MRLLLAAVVALLAAAPAHAIVGGTTIDVNEVPWFANIRGCGGTLVAPDRVVTAAHCVEGSAPQDRLSRIRIAGQTRKGVRFALHTTWDRDDVAIIQLDAPITNVAPVGLSAETADQMFVVGRGASRINHRGAGALREATLRPVTDRDCNLFYRGVRGAPFSAERHVCAVDVDGQRPLSSPCSGDSGGPLFTGSRAAPLLVGIVSFAGRFCGADRLPTAFAEIGRYAGFIVNPAPVWAPLATGPSQVTGRGRVGARLRCSVPGWETPPDRVRYLWVRVNRAGKTARAGRGATYRVRSRDRRRAIVCVAQATNAGGLAAAPITRESGRGIR
jgi:hypothetical protein